MSTRKKPCLDYHGEFREGCSICLRWRDHPDWEKCRNGTAEPSTAPVRKPLAVLPCVHRGELIREVGCPTCRGNVQLKVYSCAVHLECAFDKRAGRKVCDATCEERVEPG